MKESDIQKLLFKQFSKNHYVFINTFIFGNEEDFVTINRKSGYVTFWEVKTSVRDFKADFKKEKKHAKFKSIFSGEKVLFRKGRFGSVSKIELEKKTPNKFCYVVPCDLILPEDVPDYAGLYYMGDGWKYGQQKKAPFLHKEKIDWKEKFFNKMYYNHEKLIRQRLFKR